MIRIITEDKNREGIYRILSNHAADSFTVIPAVGFWKGEKENALVIEIVGASLETGTAIAQSIKGWNQQETVLVQYIPVESRFV